VSYRDEEGAKAARIDALEDQIEDLRAENEKLKAASAPSKKPAKDATDVAQVAPPRVNTVEALSPTQKSKREQTLFTVGSVGGGVLLTMVGLFSPVLADHGSSNTLGMPSIVALLIGGGALATSLMRVLLPDVPIMAKDADGTYPVARTMKVRRIYLALSAVAYGGGFLGWWISTMKP